MTSNATRAAAGADLFTALADLVEQHYVLPDLAADYAHRIRSHANDLAGRLPDVAAANAVLHALVPDHHLGLRVPRQETATEPSGDPPAPTTAGIQWAGELPGGLALVDIGPLFSSPDIALPALQAVGQQTASRRGLVLDLRGCHGGDPKTASLVHGWMLGPAPEHLGHFEHRGRPAIDYWSSPAVGLHFDGPVRILTSHETFSGGEDIAYIQQALGRAQVIGERTAGGAHPVEHYPLPGGQTCQIPVARPVVDATGSNWEASGVTPDTECPAALALQTAVEQLRFLSTDTSAGETS